MADRTPPPDPAARLDQIMRNPDRNFEVTLDAAARYGSGGYVYADQEQLVWSEAAGIERFDHAYTSDGGLRGDTTVIADIDGSTSCAWKVVDGKRSVTTTCEPGIENFESTILGDAIRQLIKLDDAHRVTFAGYTEQAGMDGECYTLTNILNERDGILCVTPDGIPLAMDADLQRGYYHVSLRATEISSGSRFRHRWRRGSKLIRGLRHDSVRRTEHASDPARRVVLQGGLAVTGLSRPPPGA